jgi:hypothetical protein
MELTNLTTMLKPIYVEWLDSNAYGGWRSAENLSEETTHTLKVFSLGFLLYENDVCVTITTSISTTEGVLDPLSIPKSCIILRKDIDVYEPEESA